MKIEIMTSLEKQQIFHQTKAHSPLHFQHQSYFTALRIDSVIYILSAIAHWGTINIIQKKLPAQLLASKKILQTPTNQSPVPKGDTEQLLGFLLISGEVRNSDSTPFQGFRDGLLERSENGIDVSVLKRETGRLLNCFSQGYLSPFNPKFIPGPRNHCCFPTHVVTSYIHQTCWNESLWLQTMFLPVQKLLPCYLK